MMWIFALLWCAISTPLAYFLPQEIAKGHRAAVIGYLFPLIGLMLIALAIRQTLEFARFHRSILHIDTTPVEMGARLRGRVIVPKSGDVLTHARVIAARITCYSRTRRGRSTSESIVCRNEVQIPAGSLQRVSEGLAIPINLDVPMDGRVSDTSDFYNQTLWRLNVDADVPGIDYNATFLVPVSGTAAQPFRSAPVPLSQPAVMSVIERKTADGLEIDFPPFRARGMAFGMLFATLLWIGFLALMIYVHAPFMFILVWGVFGLLFVWITLDLFFGKTAVRVAADRIHVTSSLLGSRSERDVPVSAISDVLLKIGSQGGGTVTYQIEVALKDGGRVIAGKYLKDKREAEWIASQISDRILPHATPN